MLKERSLFSIITLSFGISLILIIISFYLLNRNLEFQKQKYIRNRISYFSHRPIANIKDVENLGYEIISDTKDILENSQIIYKTQMGRKSFFYLRYKREFYLYIEAPFHSLMLKDLKHISYNKRLFFIIFSFTIAVLITLYIIVIRKLLPLKKLHSQVKRLAYEDFDLKLDIEGKDEIASLAKEFQKSAKKLKELKLSREIFTRNIMHELKTPITKGKLLLSLPENKINRELMQKVFYRLQNLIDEFSQIERFLSIKNSLNPKKYYLEDLIDSALDISFYDDTNVEKEFENVIIEADFKLFIIALKNIIDNGVKYSPNGLVTITSQKEKIIFSNVGDKLKYPLWHYFEPSYNENSDRLSLGIYITNHILKAHNISIDYEYIDGKNYFILRLPHKL